MAGQDGDGFPPPIAEAAYHGVLGEIVRDIAMHTEGDPVGILAVLASGVGNALGRDGHAIVIGDQHPARLNVVLVGKSREGAKGSAQSAAQQVLSLAVPGWYRTRRVTGLSTGEGLIKAVRDARTTTQPIRQGGRKNGAILGYEEVIEDAGVQDKRLWVVETEFARTIKVLSRETNTLSAIIRDAWDGQNLQTLTSGSPALATDPHISIVGHITPAELRRYLQATELANGFANRFLWFMVRRTQYLPDGDTLDPGRLQYWGNLLGGIVQEARERLERFAAPLRRDDEARAKWHAIYREFGAGTEGMLASILSRAEAQVLRLSVLYAVLDGAARIALPHLDAALAIWQYAHNSVVCIFGDETGDPVIDTILAALKERPLSTTEVSNRFSRHLPDLTDTLELLAERGVLRTWQVPTKGKPRSMWALAGDEPGEAPNA